MVVSKVDEGRQIMMGSDVDERGATGNRTIQFVSLNQILTVETAMNDGASSN